MLTVLSLQIRLLGCSCIVILNLNFIVRFILRAPLETALPNHSLPSRVRLPVPFLVIIQCTTTLGVLWTSNHIIVISA